MKHPSRTFIVLMATICVSLTGCAPFKVTPATSVNGTTTNTSSKAKEASSHSTAGNDTLASTSSSKSANAATFASTLQVTMAHVQMFHSNQSNIGYGWGYHGSTFRLYQTSDGGKTWSQVQLPELPPDEIRANGPGGWDYIHPTFLNPSQGWLTWVTKGQAHILRTSDGGTMWQSTSLPIDTRIMSINAMRFSTERNGWLLLAGDDSSGNAAKFLYHSQNAGMTWTLVNRSSRELTHNGFQTKMDFTPDGKSGIMATEDSTSSSIIIETTRDSGKNWSTETLPLQDGSSQIQSVHLIDVEAIAPAQERVISDVQTSDGSVLAASTEVHQGVWQTAYTTVGQIEALTWLSADSAFALERIAGKQTLIRTVDGGGSWYTAGVIPNNLIPQSPTAIQLAVNANGYWWVLFQNSRFQPSLIQTTTGGSSWQSL